MDEPTQNPRSPSTGPEFFNEPLDVSGLPQLPAEHFESLDPAYLRIRLIGDAIFAAIVVAAAAVVAFFVPWWIPVLVAGGLLAITALSAWIQRLEVRHLGYLVRDKDFSFRSGVISRNVTTVPFARVQHVSIDRGPLARYFGLATLQMRTAGDGLTVPGMSNETASRLKELVVDRAGVLADEELADSESGNGELANAEPAHMDMAQAGPAIPGPATAGPVTAGPAETGWVDRNPDQP